MENTPPSEIERLGDTKTCPVAVITRNGKVLMGLRNYTPDKWKTVSVWTIPGGRCDEGEKLETTLRREVAEETGINDLEITEYLGQVPGAKEGDVVPMFRATTTDEPQLLEPEKFSEWKWVGKDEIPENFINSLDTVVFWNDGQLLTKSDAILEALKLIRYSPEIIWLLSIIPRFFRNKIYDFIAHHRYKLFGKLEVCPIPSDSLKAQLLD